MLGSDDVRPVDELLAALDTVFVQARRPPRLEACPCCLRPDKIEALLSRPRKLLSVDDLQQYTTVAMNGAGSAEDLRYFCPRILELCHTGEMDWPDIEIVYDHLRCADWKSWPEAGAVAELMDALWTRILTDYPESDAPGDLLCAFGSAAGSVATNLASWSRLEHAAAVHSLRDFLIDQVEVRNGALAPRNPFWDTKSTAHCEVVRWLNGGAARRAVDRAIARGTEDHDLLRSLVESVEVLELGGARSSAAETGHGDTSNERFLREGVDECQR
ncbi:hypothetical protein [Nocardia sp. NBC_00416]|uniref:hypothetical protein n=1 Tax=Nocardia sp. NBC_00416 TaxID=2975991 RepID=UPI002E1AC9CE